MWVVHFTIKPSVFLLIPPTKCPLGCVCTLFLQNFVCLPSLDLSAMSLFLPTLYLIFLCGQESTVSIFLPAVSFNGGKVVMNWYPSPIFRQITVLNYVKEWFKFCILWFHATGYKYPLTAMICIAKYYEYSQQYRN